MCVVHEFMAMVVDRRRLMQPEKSKYIWVIVLRFPPILTRQKKKESGFHIALVLQCDIKRFHLRIFNGEREKEKVHNWLEAVRSRKTDRESSKTINGCRQPVSPSPSARFHNIYYRASSMLF